MFKTYSHAELGSADIFREVGAYRWQFVELEIHHPWFYIELVRDHGDDIVGSMLMVPTVPILQQLLSDLDERSWLGEAYLMSPGYLRGGEGWLMEGLVEVSVVENETGTMKDYVYKVDGGTSYGVWRIEDHNQLKVTEVIFSAERDLHG
ncbi:hypothetical protein PS865_04488 [Pseudomonas fluorescens]|uniref:hypothetical protein n=1 Tax=Pseudomonas fluorescens TaxID=294 RepID=UPI0012404C29|nr:hypothetical protein [Pseudomonas fluorescens]VVP33516.1 hypothetical protein PS865_04488 [Pseudomonas fluorescens]